MSIKPDKFVGIDLTDCYAMNPRCVDVAILDNAGNVEFRDFTWPPVGNGWPTAIVAAISAFGCSNTIFVIDGPQALAEPQNNVRRVEQHLRTPGRTSWQLPQPGGRPFAGYIRTSIEFFNALIAGGFRLAELADQANLYEAYPGAAWPRWHRGNGLLESKSTQHGCQQRREILEAVGCHFAHDGNLSHDKLDAALCAALGWRFFSPTNGWSAELAPRHSPPHVANLAAYRDTLGILREGRMLMPVSAAQMVPQMEKATSAGLPTSLKSKLLEGKRQELQELKRKVGEVQTEIDKLTTELARGSTEVAVGHDPIARMRHAPFEECDWVYFAGPAHAGQAETYDLAEQDGLIVRTAYADRQPPIAIPNVRNLQPGHTILLVYGEDNDYRALCRCRIDGPDQPVDGFHAVAIADPALAQQLIASGYIHADPVLHQHLFIPVTVLQDYQEIDHVFPRPGMSAIFRWEQVFGA